jgi:hypothetical protein
LTHWRSELENEKLFGHLEGSYRTAVNAIFSNDQNTLKSVLGRYPTLRAWIDPHDSQSLLAKAVMSKHSINHEIFLTLISSGCDAGLMDQSRIPIVQHAIISGLSNEIILSMIAQQNNTITLEKKDKNGKLVLVKNEVSATYFL